MEEIKITSIDKKPTGLVIVKYNGNLEATLNTKWQSQEVDYLEKDVGIGGSVKCEIVTKGQYINITKVDMSSGRKGEQEFPITESEKIINNPQVEKEFMSAKDEIIIAQVILKEASALTQVVMTTDWTTEDVGASLCMSVNELTGAYKLALSNIKAL